MALWTTKNSTELLWEREKGKQAVKERKIGKIDILSTKELGDYKDILETCLKYGLKELQNFPPFTCSLQVLQALQWCTVSPVLADEECSSTKLFFQCQWTEAPCGKTSWSHSCLQKDCSNAGEQGTGLAKVCAWLPCHDTGEKTRMGSSRHKAALCTAIPREDRAPQHTAFGRHTRLPTPSCKAHRCLRLLTKTAQIFRITWIQSSRA